MSTFHFTHVIENVNFNDHMKECLNLPVISILQVTSVVFNFSFYEAFSSKAEINSLEVKSLMIALMEPH